MLENLPLEILPLILEKISRPEHLVGCSLVNGVWNVMATPLLYDSLKVYSWQRSVTHA